MSRNTRVCHKIPEGVTKYQRPARITKKAKRKFQKRADPDNEQEVVNKKKMFKEAVKKARSMYMEELSNQLFSGQPQKFWNIINQVCNDESKVFNQY